MLQNLSRQLSSIPVWANADPHQISKENTHTVQNLVNGQWKKTKNYQQILDPLQGDYFINSPLTSNQEIDEFLISIQKCSKSGMHNPLKNPERYQMWGDICFKIAQQLKDNENFFASLIQRVVPKSDQQAKGEVVVTRRFFENFSGDNCRFLCQSFQVAGDHQGQLTQGYRWPYGPVSIIAPFNFPLEIPALQLFGALIVGNRPTLKCDQRVSIVMEQFIRLCIYCGMNSNEIDFINCANEEMENLIKNNKFRMNQFTGSNQVAQRLLQITNGKVKIENADWKVFGPDVIDIDYAVWQSDQDAYASNGQKCSAQSLAIIHENWIKKGFLEKIKIQAQKRSFLKGTIGPILTWNNKRIYDHIQKVLQIDGSKLLFGGVDLKNTNIPEQYGCIQQNIIAFEPTAIFVPLQQIQNHKELIHIEVFGPFQIITEYKDSEIKLVLEILESIDDHLTAGLVSNDIRWLNYMLGNTINGVTYSGSRARTTGAPQNHWFGPCGDPRAGGIGSKEAILTTWTSHREIITDIGPINKDWIIPDPT